MISFSYSRGEGNWDIWSDQLFYLAFPFLRSNQIESLRDSIPCTLEIPRTSIEGVGRLRSWHCSAILCQTVPFYFEVSLTLNILGNVFKPYNRGNISDHICVRRFISKYWQDRAKYARFNRTNLTFRVSHRSLRSLEENPKAVRWSTRPIRSK